MFEHGLVLRREHGDEGFEFLFHEPSQRWVGHEMQLAVPVARRLPDPLVPKDQSALLQVRLVGRKAIEDATILGGAANVQLQTLPTLGDWHWWWITRMLGDVELDGAQHLDVRLFWPDAERPEHEPSRRSEPRERFTLSRPDEEPPGRWGRWRRGEREVGTPPLPPFELRCRTNFWPSPWHPPRS